MAVLGRCSVLGLGLSVACLAMPARADEEIRPPWMKVEAQKQVVQLLLVASADGALGTMNFNGYGNGEMTVTVPLGWKVEVRFENKGLGALPHSLVVINEVKPLPIEGGNAAFRKAQTRALVAGLGAGETDSFQFTADKEGRFLLYCGVTGHGTQGMWDYLVVSGEAKVPSVQVKQKK
jgi:sulfocyanin